MEAVAPNLDLFLWRPVIADPPLCTWHDLRTTVTLSDMLDMHEALDLKEAAAEKAAKARD